MQITSHHLFLCSRSWSPSLLVAGWDRRSLQMRSWRGRSCR